MFFFFLLNGKEQPIQKLQIFKDSPFVILKREKVLRRHEIEQMMTTIIFGSALNKCGAVLNSWLLQSIVQILQIPNRLNDFSSPVLMIPVLCQDEESVMTVCQEEDNDLRVDCLLEPKHNYHTDYEFSMSKGQKEIIINTNISGIMPEPKFRHNTFVTELEPYGFRLTIMSFTVTENTTFICKVTKIQKTLFVELGKAAVLWHYVKLN